MPKAKRTKSVKYKGDLGKISYLDLSHLFDASQKAKTDAVAKLEYESQIAAAVAKRTDEVMLLLFDHYDIVRTDPDRWEQLANDLAETHVPAAQFTNKKSRGPGAEKVWKPQASAELCATVCEARRKIAKEKSVKFGKVRLIDAIRRVIRDFPDKWTARGGGKISAGTLQNRYNEAKRIAGPFQIMMASPYTGK